MPFSKYTVDPSHIEAMRTAFYRASRTLQPGGGENDGAMTERLVLKIMELAKGGEVDADRLCSLALLELAPRATPMGE
jgi:hypothetical protein